MPRCLHLKVNTQCFWVQQEVYLRSPELGNGRWEEGWHTAGELWLESKFLYPGLPGSSTSFSHLSQDTHEEQGMMSVFRLDFPDVAVCDNKMVTTTSVTTHVLSQWFLSLPNPIKKYNLFPFSGNLDQPLSVLNNRMWQKYSGTSKLRHYKYLTTFILMLWGKPATK